MATCSTPLQLHQRENFSTLMRIQEEFYARYPEHKDWNAVRQNQLNDLGILNELDITIPPEKMLEIFQEYGVIALRHLKNEKLLVFCGNSPIYCVEEKYNDRERKSHSHQKWDTAEFNLLMNPSCAIHWPPNQKAMGYLSQKSYQKVKGESMSVLEFNSPRALEQGLKNLSQMLDSEGESKCVYSIVPGEFFSRLDVQYFLWGNDNPLWARVYRSCFSRNWYLQGFKWLCSPYGKDEQFNVIQEIASKHEMEAELIDVKIREGIMCGTEYHKYPRPICDLYLKFTKK